MHSVFPLYSKPIWLCLLDCNFLTETHGHTGKLEVVYCSLWTGPEQGEWYAVKKAFVSPTVIVKHQPTGTGRGAWVYQSVCVNARPYRSFSCETGFCVECGNICKSLCELMSITKSLLLWSCFLQLLLWCRGLSNFGRCIVFVYGDQRGFFICWGRPRLHTARAGRRGVVVVGGCVCWRRSRLGSSLHSHVPGLVWRLR